MLFSSKKWLIASVVLISIGTGIFLLTQQKEPSPEPIQEEIPTTSREVVGHSVEGRDIERYTFGNGDANILFVGGVHGGYEWNSILLAYKAIDYFSENIDTIPESITVSIIPNANPDGTFDVLKKEGRFTLSDVPQNEGPLGTGRFNAHNVDLNRNFDCKWQSESTWRGNPVSAGTSAFSEPEAQAIKSVVEKTSPIAVIFWHSQSDAVYASECENGILPDTLTLMNTYAKAAHYRAIDTFDAYSITGDAEGWLASIHIPAITVELSTHESIEWEQNLRGIISVIHLYK